MVVSMVTCICVVVGIYVGCFIVRPGTKIAHITHTQPNNLAHPPRRSVPMAFLVDVSQCVFADLYILLVFVLSNVV